MGPSSGAIAQQCVLPRIIQMLTPYSPYHNVHLTPSIHCVLVQRRKLLYDPALNKGFVCRREQYLSQCDFWAGHMTLSRSSGKIRVVHYNNTRHLGPTYNNDLQMQKNTQNRNSYCFFARQNCGPVTETLANPYTTEIFFLLNHSDQSFFFSEIIINISVSFLRFIWIPMLWVYDHYNCFILSAQGPTLDDIIWLRLRLRTIYLSQNKHKHTHVTK